MKNEPNTPSGVSAGNSSLKETTPPAPEVPVELFKLLGHDVRNALTSIQLLTQIALRHPEAETAGHLRNFLTKIDSQSAKLCTVVNDLLDVARIQAGRMTIRRQQVRLDEFLAETGKKAAAAVGPLRVSWGRSPAATAELDPARMTQILACILSHGAGALPEVSGMDVKFELLDSDLRCVMTFRHREAADMAQAFGGLNDQTGEQGYLPNPSLYIAAALIRLHEGTVTIALSEAAGTIVDLTVPVHAVPG
ncbi:MAG TPA: histidine kinase dimerization/phospho-acceptor domain-containing protein [Sphingobacteriaceae bacterium]